MRKQNAIFLILLLVVLAGSSILLISLANSPTLQCIVFVEEHDGASIIAVRFGEDFNYTDDKKKKSESLLDEISSKFKTRDGHEYVVLECLLKNDDQVVVEVPRYLYSTHGTQRVNIKSPIDIELVFKNDHVAIEIDGDKINGNTMIIGGDKGSVNLSVEVKQLEEDLGKN